MVDDIATRHSWPPSSAAGSSGKLEKLASVGRFRSQATLLRPRDGGIVKPLCPPGSTLGQLLSGCPDAPALSIAGGGATFTRSQLAKEVAAVAATLQKHGCVRGSLVAWMLEKTDLSAVVLFLATVSFGGIAAPLSAEWSPAEAEYALQELCPALLILTQDNETPGVLAAKEIAEKVAFVTVHGEGSVQLTSTNKLSQATSFVKRVFPARASFSEAADPALALLVADGTKMSSPSVVLLTHANLLAGAAAAAAAYDLSAGDKTLLAMPLFHANGLCNGLIATLATGGEAVIPSAGRFSAATFWEDVAENGVSWVSAVPAALTLLLRHTHAWEEARRPQLRLFASSCGADLLPTETRNRIERAFNAPVVEAFALPEASMLITCNPTSGERPPGSFGTPCRGMEVAVVSPEGTELPPGEEGAVVMRGPAVCALHMRKGKAVPSPSAASPAGWVPTGRRGWMNAADGSYVIHPDPAFINQGGDRLALSEVDLSFEGFPGVAKVAAFAAVHEVMGQVVAVALEGPALASTKVTNKDLCMWAASASEHPLRARWLPQVTVLLPSERDWPAVEHPSQLAAAFKLPTLSGRASDTFIYTANSGLQRAEGDGKAGKQAKSLGRSVSLLARENKEMAILEAAVLESYAAVLPAMDDSGLGAETNFFDAGGTSLQVRSSAWRH